MQGVRLGHHWRFLKGAARTGRMPVRVRSYCYQIRLRSQGRNTNREIPSCDGAITALAYMGRSTMSEWQYLGLEMNGSH